MNNFDEQLNSIMEQTMFGGSPHERASGLKKSITFEQSSPESDAQDYQDVDMNSISEQTEELLNVIKSVNNEEPHKPGAMIKNASTDKDSVIRKTFLRLFKHKELTLFPDAATPGVASETPMIMWVCPERYEGQEDIFDEDGLMIVAHYPVPTGVEIEPRVSKNDITYHVRSGEQRVEYPSDVPVGKLIGQVTVEVYMRRSGASGRPVVTFYEDTVKL